MNTVEKRDYIHNYLYRVDDKIIDEMFKKVQIVVENDIALTHAQEKEIEKRVMRHKNGESKSYKGSHLARIVIKSVLLLPQKEKAKAAAAM